MHGAISFDGKIAAAEDAALSALSSAALYGKGVFTTVRISTGEPFLWDKHWRRLSHDSSRLGITLGRITEGFVRSALLELILQNAAANAKARITVFDETSPGRWPSSAGNGPVLLIQTSELPKLPESYRVGLSRHRVNPYSPLAGVKSCNYLESLLAFENALETGFDEAIRLDHRGMVSSACFANIFWTSSVSGKLKTPAPETGCLTGTTREFIVEKFGASEAEVSYEEFLEEAESVFLTSSVKGVAAVSSIEGVGEMDLPANEILQLFSHEGSSGLR
jgi:branched-subunit amino acid aminotransferase/4-amino-4-deoxychorismate lyase